MKDEERAVAVAKNHIAKLNEIFLEMARNGVRVEIETRGRSFVGTGMGEEGIILEAKFMRRL